MDLDPQRSWKTVLDTIDVAIRVLGRTMSSVEGREFICALGPRDAGLCLELLDRVSRCFPSFHISQTALQGLTKRPLDGGLKKAFLLTTIALAGRHGRFPSSFVVADQVEISNKILASGGFADVKPGVYENRPVAVRALRILPGSDIKKIRTVRSPLPLEVDTRSFAPAVLQGGCSLEFVVPPEYLEAPWRLGKHQRPQFLHSYRTDGARKHHAVYQDQARQQAGTGNICLAHFSTRLI